MRDPISVNQTVVDAVLTSVRVSPRTTWQHVQLKTDDGRIGLGEATLAFAKAGFSQPLLSQVRQIVGGSLAGDPLLPLRRPKMGLTERTILSAVDQAVTDLKAQAAGQPLCRYLGAETADMAIPLYANINRATQTRSPAGFAANAAAALADGFQAIKVAPFDDLTPELCGTDEAQPLIQAGLDRLRALRDTIGDHDLLVDCHWRFTLEAAEALLPALREIGVVWLECPLPETLETLAHIARLRGAANHHGMRLCGLETAGDWEEVEPFIAAGAYDLIMPDVKHAGGLNTILEIARLAQAAGTAVSLHNPSGPVAHLVSVHMMAAIGGAERLEIQWEESPLFHELTDPPPVLEDGTCRPRTPAFSLSEAPKPGDVVGRHVPSS
ncbi:MAG: enolase C-terminal domain-like protein, partial [Pseudomonadota bacterium]